MKINWNEKYTTISIYSFIVVCSSIVFYLIASQLSVFTGKINEIMGIMQPFIIGFIIAYLLNFILKFYEEILNKLENFKKLNKKSKRGISLVFTYITAFLIVYLFMNFVVPQLIESVVGLANNIPDYLNNVTILFEKTMTELEVDPQYLDLVNEKLNQVVNYIIQFATDLIPILGNWVVAIASSIWNIILGLIVSSYLLIDKERFYGVGKKIIYATSSKRVANRIFELVYRSNYTFGRFLSGQILDSAIVGVLTFFVLNFFKMPYSTLISVIIGITNIIPFFGPFFGAIPSAIIILFVSPIKAVWFLIIILIIQQIDGNIMSPKILGDSIGISAFWILFALLVAGKFFGLVGMVVGVPIFAIIYSVMKEVVEGKLRNKGLPEDTKDYM